MKNMIRKKLSLINFILITILLLSMMNSSSQLVFADDCSSNQTPYQPTNPFPSSGSNQVSQHPILSWDCTDPDDDTLTYDVYFSKNLPVKKQSLKQPLTTYDPGTLQYNTRYYWMIIAYDSCGNIAVGNLWTFVTEPNPDPHPPTITQHHPLENATNITSSVTLSVTVNDVDNDELTVTFYDDASNAVLSQKNCESGQTVSTIWNNLVPNTDYQWYVTINDGIHTVTSDKFSFSTQSDQNELIADAGDYYFGKVNEIITLNASNSYDPQGTITGYKWDFNNDEIWDTEWRTNSNIDYVFSTEGTYTVNLLVKNDNEQTDADSCTVHITDSDQLHPIAEYDITPINPTENEEITFDATNSYDPDGTIISYRWSFKNNNNFTSWQNDEIITYTYTTVGTYQVSLQVKDDDDLINTTSQTIHVTNNSNHPPNTPQKPNGPNNGFTQTTYTFSTTTTDEDEDNVKYGWDWNNDETVDTWTEYTSPGSSMQIQHTWSNPGTYTISVKAQDEHGLKSDLSETITITINTTSSNEKYCPDPPSNPSPSNNENDVSLIGVYLEWDCSDPDEDDLVYTVYLDTSTEFDESVGENIETTQYCPGRLQKETTYYWKVIVYDKTDGCRNESPVWQFTTTDNSKPAQPQKPTPANGETNVDPCALLLTWESSDSDNDELQYTIYFDDSQNPSTPLGSPITSTSVSAGMLEYDTTYYWSVQVTDKKSNPVKSIDWSFKTKPEPCQAKITGPTDAYSGDKVTFSASNSECEGYSISSYDWNFGDGETANGETASHVFRGNKTFTVTLTVKCKPDCLSCSHSITHRIHIGNHKPDKPIVSGGPPPIIGGQKQGSYTYTVKGHDSDGDKIRFRFDWGDNTSNTVTDYVSSGKEITVSHSWMKPGNYEIKVYSEDVSGDMSLPVYKPATIGSAVNIAMVVIVFLGIAIVSVQVIFVVIAHRKKMFQ